MDSSARGGTAVQSDSLTRLTGRVGALATNAPPARIDSHTDSNTDSNTSTSTNTNSNIDTNADTNTITLPAMANVSEPLVPTLTSIVPLCTSGMALLGDLRKFVSLSSDRFTNVACATGALSFTVLGVAGETVPVTMLSPTKPPNALVATAGAWVKVRRVTIPASGRVDVVVPTVDTTSSGS